jgi:allantoin racemase
MPKIRIVFIGHQEKDFIEEQRKYRQQMASPGFTLEITCIRSGPETIEGSLEEVLASQSILQEVIAAENDLADAVIVDCALDPILSASREAVGIPVVGAGQAAYALATTLGDRFSIIVPVKHLVPEYRRRVWEYGLSQRLASIRAMDVRILDLLGDPAVDACVLQGRRAIEEDGADVLVLGCTGMSPTLPRLRERLEVPIVDPASAAISLAETLINLHLSSSGRSFPRRRPKID